MKIVHAPNAFRNACDLARVDGKRVALVPTMGALHQGHFSLLAQARQRADFVAATIFVNPLQFGEGEDLARYPRTWEADLEGCATHGADLVFSPDQDAMYPDGFQTTVAVGGLTQVLEGEHRPTHFDGVTTVVAKLFHLAGPCTAVFGRKDYQQWKVLCQMVRDLDMPIDIVGAPIIRETDGLALSSRNRYLSAQERERALGIVQGLRAAFDAWHAGERNPAQIQREALKPVAAKFDRIDYVAGVDPETLKPASGPQERLLIVVAAHLGTTRLIDNLVVGEDPRP